jgi:hypothetical protein
MLTNLCPRSDRPGRSEIGTTGSALPAPLRHPGAAAALQPSHPPPGRGGAYHLAPMSADSGARKKAAALPPASFGPDGRRIPIPPPAKPQDYLTQMRREREEKGEAPRVPVEQRIEKLKQKATKVESWLQEKESALHQHSMDEDTDETLLEEVSDAYINMYVCLLCCFSMLLDDEEGFRLLRDMPNLFHTCSDSGKLGNWENRNVGVCSLNDFP